MEAAKEVLEQFWEKQICHFGAALEHELSVSEQEIRVLEQLGKFEYE